MISAKAKMHFLTPSQTAMSEEVKSASESSSPQKPSFSHLDRWFPAELVLEIVKYLPLYELIFSARLRNKMWNTFAQRQSGSKEAVNTETAPNITYIDVQTHTPSISSLYE